MDTSVPQEGAKPATGEGGEKEKEAAATAKKPVSATAGPGPGGLPFFGYSIFAEVPAAFQPSAVGPADPEYVIGPGDVLKVSVCWAGFAKGSKWKGKVRVLTAGIDCDALVRQ